MTIKILRGQTRKKRALPRSLTRDTTTTPHRHATLTNIARRIALDGTRWHAVIR